MDECRCGVQDARGVADAPPRKIRKFRIYVKFDEIGKKMVVRKFRKTTPQGVVEHLQYNFPQKSDFDIL